jgi:hypothetical protein
MKKRNVLPACKNGPSAGLEEWPTCYQPGRTHTCVESSQSFIPPWSASLEGTMHPLHNEMEERRPQLCQYSLPLRAKFAPSSAKIWKPQNGIKHANVVDVVGKQPQLFLIPWGRSCFSFRFRCLRDTKTAGWKMETTQTGWDALVLFSALKPWLNCFQPRSWTFNLVIN